MDETLCSLEDVGDEVLSSPPAQVRCQFDFSNCFQLEDQRTVPEPPAPAWYRRCVRRGIAPRTIGWSRRLVAPEIWRGERKAPEFPGYGRVARAAPAAVSL